MKRKNSSSSGKSAVRNHTVEEIEISSSSMSNASKRKTPKRKDSDEYEFEVEAEDAMSDEDVGTERPRDRRYNKYAGKERTRAKKSVGKAQLSQTSSFTAKSNLQQS